MKRSLVVCIGLLWGCGGRIAGDDLDFVYTLPPTVPAGGEFSFDSTTTLGGTLSNNATLSAVTVQVMSPDGETFAFLADLSAQNVSGTVAPVQVVSFVPTKVGGSVPLRIDYSGALSAFLTDGNTLKFHWVGHLDNSFGLVPAQGIAIRVAVGIHQ